MSNSLTSYKLLFTHDGKQYILSVISISKQFKIVSQDQGEWFSSKDRLYEVGELFVKQLIGEGFESADYKIEEQVIG